MEKLYLEVPSIERKEEAIDYINEQYAYNSPINGSGGLERYLDDYEGWLMFLDIDRNRKVGDPNRVPAETYFLIRESDNKIVGMVNIRLALNSTLRASSGHIGYSIRPTERRKGYNKANLYLALEVCDNHNIEKVMLSCNKDNDGSRKTILALGGILEKEYEKDDHLAQNYWIDVKESLEKYKDIYATQKEKKR